VVGSELNTKNPLAPATNGVIILFVAAGAPVLRRSLWQRAIPSAFEVFAARKFLNLRG
jgi:hypothetical protein